MNIVPSSPSLTNRHSVVSHHAVDTVSVSGVVIEADPPCHIARREANEVAFERGAQL
jgi:hypothetical protein